MASNLKPLPPLPAATQPVVDPRTGRVTPAWYSWLRFLEQHMRETEDRVTDLETP